MSGRLLIIGYGNELRGDDAAGPMVARTVAGWGCEDVVALSVQQLTPELADLVAEARQVIFVDASVSQVEVKVEAIEPAFVSPTLGHVSDPRWLLALVQMLYDRCPRAWLISIPAVNLAFGENLSPMTERGMDTALDHLTQRL